MEIINPPSYANEKSYVQVRPEQAYEKYWPYNEFIRIQRKVMRQESTTMSTART